MLITSHNTDLNKFTVFILDLLWSGKFTLHLCILADAFIQRNLQCIQAIHFCQYVCSLGTVKVDVKKENKAECTGIKSLSTDCQNMFD